MQVGVDSFTSNLLSRQIKQLNLQIQANYAELSSTKQNVIDGTNPLNPATIQSAGEALTPQTVGHLATANADVQAQINAKWATPTNATNLAHVDITTNLTELLTAKQDVITDGALSIAKTNGLQEVLDSKQSVLLDGDLSISITDGLQASLDSKQPLLSNENLLNCSYVGSGNVTNAQLDSLIGIETTSTIQSQLDNHQTILDTLEGLQDLDITNIPILQSNVTALQQFQSDQLLWNEDIEASITDLESGKQNNIQAGDLAISSTFGLQSALDSKQNIITDGSLTIARTSGLQSALDGKQDTITEGSLSISDTYGLQSAIDGKQATITDGSLTIARTSGLQSALDGKQATITDGSLTIARTSGLQSALDGKQPTITDGSLTIARTSGLQSALDGKQDTLSTSNRLPATYISTTINSTNGVLSNVLQSIVDSGTLNSTTIAAHTDTLTNINNSITGINTSLTTIDTNITSLQSQDITHTNAISQINDTLSTKQDIIDSAHPLSGDSVEVVIDTVTYDLTMALETMNDGILSTQNILDNKQNTLGSSNKLPIAYVNLGTSPLSYVDISSSLSTQLTNITDDILTLNGLQSGDISSFNAINSAITTIQQDISDIEAELPLKQDVIDSSHRLDASLLATGEVTNTKFNFLKNVTSDIQTQINNISGGGGGSSIPSITYDSGTTTTTIADTTEVSEILFAGDSTTQSTAFTSSLKTTLESNTTKLTDVSYSTGVTTVANTLQCDTITGTTISDLETAIDGKQNIINGTATLNPSYLTGGSSLTSQKIGWLASIAQDLQTKLDALQSSIDALIASDSAQTTTNSTLSSSISSLTSSKQDVLSSENKLNSSFINAGTGSMTNLKMQYLSSIGGDISDAINSKWNTPSNASSLGYVNISSSLTDLLNGKQPTITNNSLLISYTDGLQTALDGKQPTITNDSLTIAHTSGLQTALDAKQNTITDGSLTIAQTNGLQTSLDQKLNLSGGTLTGVLQLGGNLQASTYRIGSGTSLLLNGTTSISLQNSQIEMAKVDNTGIVLASGKDVYVGGYGVLTHLAFKRAILETVFDRGALGGSVTMDDTYLNAMHTYSPTGARNITLPSQTTYGFSAGTWIAICNYNTTSGNNLVIKNSGGTTIYTLSNVTTATQAGNGATFVWDGSGWRIKG